MIIQVSSKDMVCCA